MVIPTSFCNEVSADPAVLFVGGGYDTFVNLATESYELALQQTEDLGNFVVTPLAFNVSFNFDDQLAPFQRPTKPVLNFAGLEFDDPGSLADPPAFVAEPPEFDEAPDFDVAAPVLAIGPRPDTPVIALPTAPALSEPVLPEEPDLTMPEAPTFEQLNLPSVPTITLPTFTSSAPTMPQQDVQEFAFTPEAYVSDGLNSIKAKIAEWLQGGTGLPAAIEDALFARAMGRVDEGNTADLQLARDMHSSLGFTEPNGLLNARVIAITDKGLKARSEFSRELTIRFHEEELTNLRLAVQQGVALEGVLVNLHLEEQRMLLAAATYLRDSSIAVLNARISIFNAQLQAYQTDASVFETRIRAALAEIEVYKAQIEGERIRGEINEQYVRRYAEMVRAVGIAADVYKTRVEAVQAETEFNRQRVMVFGEQINAYGKQWDAFGKQLDAYRADVDGQKARADIYDTQARAFGTRVSAWDRVQNVRLERERLRIQQHGQELTGWRGGLDRLLAYVQKEQARISSVAQTIDAQARIYQADAAIETAASAATDRSFELGLRREEARTNVALKQAEMRIQEAIQLLSLVLRAKETQTQVIGQLTAASMSAVNFSAGVSSSVGRSQSCSTSVGWSGEAPDLE